MEWLATKCLISLYQQFPAEAKMITNFLTSAVPTIININEETYVNSWKQIPKFFTQDKVAY